MSTLVFSICRKAVPKTGIEHKKMVREKTLQIVGENIIDDPLMPRDKILFLPMHKMLGLMKRYVKALDKNDHFFRYFI